MSETSSGRPVSGLAITSLVLGILTLLMFWVPILHLAPGLLAIVLGIIGLRMARRGAASGGGLAVAGIICAILGMIPTFLLGLAVFGLSLTGPEFALEGAGQEGPAGVTLRITRNEFFQDEEAYDIEQDAANIGNTSSSSGVERKEFEFASIPAGQVKYTGTLEVTAPKQLAITVELENQTPFQLGVEGLNEVAAEEDDQPLSLDEPLSAGKHSIRITGTAP